MGKTKRKASRRSAGKIAQLTGKPTQSTGKQNSRPLNRQGRLDPARLAPGPDDPRRSSAARSSGGKHAKTIALFAVALAVLALFAQSLSWRSGLQEAENARQAAEIVAASSRGKTEKTITQVGTLQHTIAGLKAQLADQQSEIANKDGKIAEQRTVIARQENLIAEHRLRQQQEAALLDETKKGTKIEPGQPVSAGKPANVKGDLVTPDQQPARFVTVDAWRADTRIATTVSDKNGRFSLQLPRGDDVVLKFTSPGRITNDIPLSGTHDNRLKVLVIDRDPDRIQR
jgi:hypothetical protein